MRHRLLPLSAALALVILLFGGTALTLALQGNSYLATTHDPSEVLTQVRLAERKGALLHLDNDGLNQLLAVFAPRITKNPPIPGLAIHGINGTMDDNLVTLYAPVTYRSLPLLLSASGRLAYTNEHIAFEPEALKVGNLTVPTRLALGVINRLRPGDLTVTDHTIILSKSFVPFVFSSLAVADGQLSIYVDRFPPALVASMTPSTAASTTSPTVASSSPAGPNTLGQAETSASSTPQPASVATITPNTAAPTQPPAPLGSPTQAPPSGPDPSSSSTPAQAQQPPSNPSPDSTTNNLKRLFNQLNAVMAELTTVGQREVIDRIQSSIGRTIADPTHDFIPEAEQVRKLYVKLTNDERTALKVAILTNIDAQLIVELRTTYGI